MTIIRAPRVQQDFTILSNSVCLDKRLTMRALGVLVRLLCRPDNWRTNSEGLAAEFGCGRDAVRGALQELQQSGYIRMQKTQGANGQWSSVWLVFDRPQTEAAFADAGKTDAGLSDAGKTDAGKADAGKTDAGKAGAITRTDETRTDETRTDETRTDETRARKRAAPASRLTAQDLKTDGVDESYAESWLAIRREKRLPLTAGAWELTKAGGAAHGLSPADTVRECLSRGWAAFREDWYGKGAASRPMPLQARQADLSRVSGLLGFDMDADPIEVEARHAAR